MGRLSERDQVNIINNALVEIVGYENYKSTHEQLRQHEYYNVAKAMTRENFDDLKAYLSAMLNGEEMGEYCAK